MTEPRVRLVLTLYEQQLREFVAGFNAAVKAQLPRQEPVKLPPPLELDE